MSHIAERANGRNWTGWLAVLCFILTIPVGNWVVMNVGLVCDPNGPCVIPVWPGLMAPSAVLLAGLALVLRDVVHQMLGGRWALYCIVAGAVLSAVFSEPSLVLASACAFLFSELADFVVYTPLRNKSLGWAVVLSGLVGSVVDSAIFLSMAFGSLEFIAGQVLGKFWMSLLGLGVLMLMRRRHDAATEGAVAS